MFKSTKIERLIARAVTAFLLLGGFPRRPGPLTGGVRAIAARPRR